MDSHEWRELYRMIRLADKSVPGRSRRTQYSDVLIVAMYLWSTGHDRPMYWACDRSHYASCFRPPKLPSVSQFSRRLRSPRCRQMLAVLHDLTAETDQRTDLSFLDGRALRVGAHTKDGDAGRGYAPGGMAKGYKLHVWADADGRVPVWSLEPLNVSEKTVAGHLLACRSPDGLVLADRNYDAGHLYDQVADAGGQLMTPPPKNVGGGHRRASVPRLANAVCWPNLGKYVYQERLTVERILGWQCSSAVGLYALPPWVRTLPRVRRWVGAKLIIYHVHRRLRRRVA